jgi:hypothetical protein
MTGYRVVAPDLDRPEFMLRTQNRLCEPSAHPRTGGAIRHRAPFLNGALAAGNALQKAHPFLPCLKNIRADQHGRIPTVLGDEQGGAAFPHFRDDARGMPLQIRHRFVSHSDKTVTLEWKTASWNVSEP